MTVLDIFTLIRRGWKILAVTLVIGALAGVAYGFMAPKVYQSTASGFIAANGTAVVNGSDEAVARAGAYLVLINSSKVRETIAQDAGIETSKLSGSLSARVAPGSTLIEVTASARDPQDALNLANGALNALAKVVAGLEEMAGNTGENSNGITILPMDSAVAPTAPSSPNVRLAIGAGALAGLVLGLIIVILRRALDVRVRAHTDVAALAGAGILGRVPKINVTGTSKKDALTRTIADEAYRQIRTGLRFSSVDHEVSVVMITSANQGEGKSLTARSLARVMAESGRPTLIIDGDLRRPTVAEGFEIDGTIGLSEVLSGQVDAPSAIRQTAERRLFVLASGGLPPNPSEMLGSTAMHNLLAELRRDFFIIIDAPPVLPVTDASVLSTAVDGIVFVTAVGRTRRAEVVEARTQLEQVHARVLGVVLNLVSVRGDENGYGYYRQNNRYYAQASAIDEGPDATQDEDYDPFVAFTDITPAPFPQRGEAESASAFAPAAEPESAGPAARARAAAAESAPAPAVAAKPRTRRSTRT